MAIEKVELRHECFPNHLHVGSARMEDGKETKEKDKTKRVKMESKLRNK